MKPKTILVTGGAGFIGSHLVDALLERKANVIAIDNLQTGSKKNIAHLRNNPHFRFLKHDITRPLPRLPKVHQIYNLACPASPVHYQKDPLSTIRTNTIGVMNVLELARKQNARILQASTSEVYGDPDVHPQTEDYHGNVNTLGPRACYDEGKRVAETLVSDYHRVYGVDIRIARIFNTYGPRMATSDGRVISNFIVQALRGKPITVYGTGTQTRSLCYVSDIVTGLIMLMESSPHGGPINLGNPDEYSMSAIAKKVIAATTSKALIRFAPLPEDDPRRRRPDITRAKKFLGWKPRVSLEKGLAHTIAYFITVLK